MPQEIVPYLVIIIIIHTADQDCCFMLRPPEPFELPEDNEVEVIFESVFFKTFGLAGCEGK